MAGWLPVWLYKQRARHRSSQVQRGHRDWPGSSLRCYREDKPRLAAFMAPVRRRRGAALFRGRVFLVFLVAVALDVASTSPRRGLGALAAADDAAGPETEMNSGPEWHVVSVADLLPAAVCTASQATSNSPASAFSVVHRHGPCSPLRTPGDAPSDADLLDQDQARVDSIHGRITNETVQGVSLPAERGISVGTGNYVVSVGLGTPARDLTVVFDTGSDLSWVQCAPCSGCYKQQDPLFAPSNSSTFSAVPCARPECRARQSCSSSPDDARCPYEVVYGDKSRTEGHLGNDTLTLGALTTPSANASSEDNSNKLAGFVFGCGENNTGLFGQADGLFGLGRGKVSLSSQAAGKYGEGFSYCLPSSSSTAPGYLALGAPAPAPAHAQFTRMLNRTSTPSFYYVSLVGIRVAGRAVRVSSRVALPQGLVIVDSGTVITRLAPRAYRALRTAFLSAMGKYGYKRAPRLSILDTCYDFTAHANATVSIPAVALVFAGGATISVDFSGVLYVAKVAQACLAFAANADGRSAGILGNTQQRTLAVVYDVGRKRIGFAAKGCS